MGNKLFGVDISGLIAKNIGPGVLDATLTKVVPGTRTSGSLTAGTNPSSTSHTAKGFIDDYEDSQRDGTRIQQTDRKIILIGDTISPAVAPQGNDRITIEGTLYYIVAVERDPAAATYTCQVRGV